MTTLVNTLVLDKLGLIGIQDSEREGYHEELRYIFLQNHYLAQVDRIIVYKKWLGFYNYHRIQIEQMSSGIPSEDPKISYYEYDNGVINDRLLFEEFVQWILDMPEGELRSLVTLITLGK
jgi:hypothetical protein